MSRSTRRHRFPHRLGRIVGVVGLAVGAAAARAWWWPSEGTKPADSAAHGEIAGRARVVDGDSLVIEGRRLRLVGIDAPELAQSCRLEGMDHPCGDEARAHLEWLIDGRAVRCVWDRRDKYHRPLVTCRRDDVDLGARMVRDGWAIAYGAHDAEEADARAHGRGLWSGSFEGPEDFRRHVRAEHEADRAAPWWVFWR